MSSTTGEKLKVQVVYALPDVQRVIAIEVPRGATLRNAVERSRIAEHFPDLDLAPLYDRYAGMLAGGTKPNLAKLSLARIIAATVLRMWKDEEEYKPQ